jgi:hypothetical protein
MSRATPAHWALAFVVTVVAGGEALAQVPAVAGEGRGPIPPGAPMLTDEQPLQCWWRTSAGAVRLGEPFDVTLTCAALESDARRAVADESRLTVAAIQLAPFEIIDGGRAPELRDGDRRFFQHRYRLRLISPDVVGFDVKLPPLAIPYRIESRVGGSATLAGRDLSHLMPQIAIRVVSQVPADADDIRDSSDASLARIDTLRFRANAFNLTAWVLAAIAGIAALSALVPAFGLVRRTRQRTASKVADRAVLTHAARVLDERLHGARGAGWTPEALADAHAAARVVAAVVTGVGARELHLGRGAATPAGRLRIRRRFGRQAAAVTTHVTSQHLATALATLPGDASSHARARVERLRDALATLTRAQYGASTGATGAGARDTSDVDVALASTRDLAREVARERLFTPREWFRRASPGTVAPDF